MSQGETARKTYEGARWEITTRIKLREQILLIYLGAVGTIFGVAFGVTAQYEILFVIPFVSVGSAILLSQHDSAIGVLVYFCTHELNEFLAHLEPPEDCVQWDNSKTLSRFGSRSLFLRTSAHIIILIVPCVMSLIGNWSHALQSPFPYGPLWWFSLLLSIVAIFVIIEAHSFRKKIYAEYKWQQ